MRPKSLQIDKHADILVTHNTCDDEDFITSKDLADLLRVSLSWVEKSRANDYGPPYIRLSPHCIRYSRTDVLAWLKQRAHAHDVKLYGNWLK